MATWGVLITKVSLYIYIERDRHPLKDRFVVTKKLVCDFHFPIGLKADNCDPHLTCCQLILFSPSQVAYKLRPTRRPSVALNYNKECFQIATMQWDVPGCNSSWELSRPSIASDLQALVQCAYGLLAQRAEYRGGADVQPQTLMWTLLLKSNV